MPDVKILVLSHPLRDLGVTPRVHLWLNEKHIVDFLLTIIELVSLALMAAAQLSEMSKSAFSEGVGHLSKNFGRWGRRP